MRGPVGPCTTTCTSSYERARVGRRIVTAKRFADLVAIMSELLFGLSPARVRGCISGAVLIPPYPDPQSGVKLSSLVRVIRVTPVPSAFIV